MAVSCLSGKQTISLSTANLAQMKENDNILDGLLDLSHSPIDYTHFKYDLICKFHAFNLSGSYFSVSFGMSGFGLPMLLLHVVDVTRH